MKLTANSYKFNKILNYFKRSNIFFIANTITPKNNIKTSQLLKNLNLNYYKLQNKLTKQTLIYSIFHNYQFLIGSVIMLIIPKKIMNLKTYDNKFVLLLGVKLNNKIYLINNIPFYTKFDYNQDFVNLIQTFKTNLKLPKNLNIN